MNEHNFKINIDWPGQHPGHYYFQRYSWPAADAPKIVNLWTKIDRPLQTVNGNYYQPQHNITQEQCSNDRLCYILDLQQQGQSAFRWPNDYLLVLTDQVPVLQDCLILCWEHKTKWCQLNVQQKTVHQLKQLTAQCVYAVSPKGHRTEKVLEEKIKSGIFAERLTRNKQHLEEFIAQTEKLLSKLTAI